jgi:hypothetical protein
MPNYDGRRPFHPHVEKRLPSGNGNLVVPYQHHKKDYKSPDRRDNFRPNGYNNFRPNGDNNFRPNGGFNNYVPRRENNNRSQSHYQPQDSLIRGLREKSRTASVAGTEMDENRVLEDLDTVYRNLRQKITSGDEETVNAIWYSQQRTYDDDQESGQMSQLTDPRERESIFAGNAEESYYDFGGSQKDEDSNM